MSQLEWGLGPRPFDMGLDRGVLYLPDPVPWNGLVTVDERAISTADVTFYYDGRQMGVAQETSDFKASVQAYTYPDIFAEYNGYSEELTYKRFGMSYRTQYGEGYLIHLVYNALVVPTSRQWTTVKDKIDPSLFTWDISTSTVEMFGSQPAAHLVIDSASMGPVVAAIEAALYGTANSDPRLPTAEEIIELYEDAMSLKVTYNRDGTYTVDGPDQFVSQNPDGTFEIDAPSAYLLEAGKFVVSSYGQ